ncbi:MAG TPA: polar localization protein TipN [Phenylobacterium sp.]|jgi:hypothetical protein
MRIRKRTRPADFAVSPRETFAEVATDAPEPVEDAPQLQPAEPPSWTAVETARVHSAVAAPTPHTPVRLHAPDEEYEDAETDDFAPPPAWPVYLVALAVAGLWALGPIAFALGYRQGLAPLRDNAFALLVFGLLAVGPGVFVFFAAYMVRQGQKLGAEARRAKAMAEDMLAPAMTAAARAGQVTQGVREEILRAGEAAEEAREALLALREALASESQQLLDSAQTSVRGAQELTTTLGRERSEMGALAHSLDAQATRVAESISQQARMVAEASEVAEAQLREAEAALSARAADITAAAGEANTAARTAGEDLTRHIARLETAGAGVAEQVRSMEGGLTEQRTALVTLAETLKADNEDFANQAEAHAAKLTEFIDQTRQLSNELSDRALKGGEDLRAVMADAVEQFRSLAETAKVERDELGQSARQTFETVSEAAAEQRAKLEEQTRAAIEALAAAAEQTRAAAASHAASAREQVDQLSEAAAEAGQKANEVFEARLTEARALVAQSSEVVDQAGLATARRLEESAAAARESMIALQEMMAEIDRRAAQLPASAQSQVDQVRAAVSSGLDELMIQARRTAEEAQSIDAAFQERARRNFEMLSEAVRLMGASAALPLAPPAPLPTPMRAAPAPAPPEAKPQPEPAPLAVAPEAAAASVSEAVVEDEDEPADDDALALEDLMEPAPAREPIEDPGLRPRLKLTPTATDEEFSAVFEAAGGPPSAEDAPHEGESWTWKDLLASIDGAEGEGHRLQDILGAEIAKMGVDPGSLLPQARIDQVAAAIQTGDQEGARIVIKRLAPVANRRIQRRLLTDDDLKQRAEVYIRRYQTLVDDAMVRDPEGFQVASLLGDDAGRIYLLLDAAAGDLN